MRKFELYKYQSVSNPEEGYIICVEKHGVSLWIDQCEGGEAHESDLTYEDDFTSLEKAQDYIKNKWGDVNDIIY